MPSVTTATAAMSSSSFSASKTSSASKYVIIMVGLPARGKTYISTKLCRYLNWIGVPSKVFNVGIYRRKATDRYKSSDFFNPENVAAMNTREAVARKALDDSLKWLDTFGEAVIFDATNTTVERRKWVYETAMSRPNVKCVFLESICDDPEVIDSTVREVKVNGLDYIGVDFDKAQSDFNRRIQHYMSFYVEVGTVPEESHYSYMKIINAGEKVILNKNEGRLHARIAYWLMNTHIQPRSIYLTRHGECEYNVLGRIGGDSDLTANGRQYAKVLADYFETNSLRGSSPLKVWTSTLKRTIHTASELNRQGFYCRTWKLLNEIDGGICEELTYDSIIQQFPEVYKARSNDKLGFRYPGGESYRDVITRLEPVMMELERTEDVLVIAHQAVLRCILAYFTDGKLHDMPYLEVPLHTLIKLTPIAQGCNVSYIPFTVPAVNTHHDSKRLRTFPEGTFSESQDSTLTLPRIEITPATPEKEDHQKKIEGIEDELNDSSP